MHIIPHIMCETIYKKLKIKFVAVKEIQGNGFLSNIFKNIAVLNTIF